MVGEQSILYPTEDIDKLCFHFKCYGATLLCYFLFFFSLSLQEIKCMLAALQ